MEKLTSTLTTSSGTMKVYMILVFIMTAIAYLYITFYRKSKKFMEYANQIPGPRPYPLIGTVHLYGFTPTDIYTSLLKYSKCFGPVSGHWIGPEFCVVVTQATDIEAILSSKIMIEKPNIYTFTKPTLGLGLVTAAGERWKKHRRIISPTFHFKVMEEYVEVFNEKARLLATKLEDQVDNPHFNIEPYFSSCTFDVLCESAFATTNMLNEYPIFAAALTAVNRICISRAFRPWLHPEFFFNLSADGKESNKNVKVVNSFITKVIKNKREAPTSNKNTEIEAEEGENEPKRLAFLDHLLRSSQDESNQFNDNDIMDEMKTFFTAGTDTLNAALGMIAYILSNRFEIQEKIVEEIKEVFGSLDDNPFTVNELQKLKYLERVIKEALRLYPSIPLIARNVPVDFKLPSGYTLPQGSTVAIVFHALHRDPEAFPNPEEFNPDNFLTERLLGRNPYAYCPFSAGPRNCIGQKYSMLQLKAVMVSILRKYWLLPTKFELGFSIQISMRATGGIYVGLKRRTEERPIISQGA